MRVRFLQRCGAYFPGADPVLDRDEAARVIALGFAEPFDKPAPPAPKPAPIPEPVVEEPTEVDAEAPTLPVEESKPAPAPQRAIRRR